MTIGSYLVNKTFKFLPEFLSRLGLELLSKWACLLFSNRELEPPSTREPESLSRLVFGLFSNQEPGFPSRQGPSLLSKLALAPSSRLFSILVCFRFSRFVSIPLSKQAFSSIRLLVGVRDVHDNPHRDPGWLVVHNLLEKLANQH